MRTPLIMLFLYFVLMASTLLDKMAAQDAHFTARMQKSWTPDKPHSCRDILTTPRATSQPQSLHGHDQDQRQLYTAAIDRTLDVVLASFIDMLGGWPSDHMPQRGITCPPPLQSLLGSRLLQSKPAAAGTPCWSLVQILCWQHGLGGSLGSTGASRRGSR